MPAPPAPRPRTVTVARLLTNTNMATYAPIPTPTPGYSFISYPPPSDPYTPHFPASHTLVDMSGMSSPHPYSSAAAHHFAAAQYSHLPPSPMLTHTHGPPSPVTHGSGRAHSPNSPDRHSQGSAPSQVEGKLMRQMMAQMQKLQGTVREMAERQEQVLDRMSVLEQRGWWLLFTPGIKSVLIVYVQWGGSMRMLAGFWRRLRLRWRIRGRSAQGWKIMIGELRWFRELCDILTSCAVWRRLRRG